MLEKMKDFFEARLDDYEDHMLTCIASAPEFYAFTAACLPPNARLLDLGCGTGLELNDYFARNPDASVTGIDLSEKMLKKLKEKFPTKALDLIVGSYFDLPFGNEIFDAAVSVESLHHFTKEEKIPLYQKLRHALKPHGYFILTDYFAYSDEDEKRLRQNLLDLKKSEGIKDGEFYHYDTPLTVEHELEALLSAGFPSVQILNRWENTYTLKALV